ncbi:MULTISPECIES: hypothetical protein [unclassified Streptomyces]|uniref:hypothetical protein n=1 Tax=unclassified Streptomyces TaxID=2593676 RepID=UPI002253E6F3|nr:MULTISPECIES: hypothetical protein [unclassified Streptomyces]WSP57191.1 hypothetical protein OG306_24535 [Streptomyces sp. NBC_01241]WSU22091.1 hypothetical protein OG508_14695 [Streptomyces sp. NBC_01108]MCX4789002.1 hypothetical protein [Streptomyces sp. NBC_01221]MCX4795253.1 hypothetical protein [Streptomyces sp. NBC_01242]WSJ36565.1 hypothetical protein OG772_11315 [Streptomyces sp. NBC_01321]
MNGQITFVDHPDNATETVTVPVPEAGEEALQNISGNLKYFRLENVSSRVLITLCRDPRGRQLRYKLQTYGNPTTTEFITIDDLAGQSDGQIIARGLRLSGHRDGEQPFTLGSVSVQY